MPTNKEKWLMKHRDKYDTNALVYSDIDKLPHQAKMVYLIQNLNTKYNTIFEHVSCIECMKKALFFDSGYTSEEEIIQKTSFKHR